MLEDERISAEPCGCRYDVVTQLRTHVCEEHERERECASVRSDEPRGWAPMAADLAWMRRTTERPR